MTNRQQSAFFLAIVFLFTSGIGLVIYRQYDLYYQQKTAIDIETAQTPSVALEKSSASSTPAQISGWKTYKNDEYGFEFKYPNSWYTLNWVKEQNELLEYTLVSSDFNYGKTNDASAGDTTKGVKLQVTLISYSRNNSDNNCKTFGGYGVSDCSEVVFDGYPALQINSPYGGYSKLLYIIKKDNLVFTIGFDELAIKGDTSSYDQIFNEILSTFKFTK